MSSDLEQLCKKYERNQNDQKRLREELKGLKSEIMEYVDGRKNAKHVGSFSIKIKRTLCCKPLTSIKVLMENLDLSKHQLIAKGLVHQYERQTLEVTRRLPTNHFTVDSYGDTTTRRRMIVE